MDLLKTTILPTDSKDDAQRILRHYIHELPKILLVVLGKGEEAEQFAARADKLAGAPSDPRWVIWIRQPSKVEEILAGLTGDPALLGELPTCRGFSLSLVDRVCDVIKQTDAVPSLVRVLQMYAAAEADHA